MLDFVLRILVTTGQRTMKPLYYYLMCSNCGKKVQLNRLTYAFIRPEIVYLTQLWFPLTWHGKSNLKFMCAGNIASRVVGIL
jgi:hypothetical protein